MKKFGFNKGLVKLNADKDIYAYIQPDGGWGLNNAGLLVADNNGILIDTLFDMNYTGEMLDEMSEVVKNIDKVIVTHSNGDHFYGLQHLANAEIYCSSACAEEMSHIQPIVMAGLMNQASEMGPAGKFLEKCFGKFDFNNIDYIQPTNTFKNNLTLNQGSCEIQLIQVLPSHTNGDIMVNLPEERILFAGDLIFNQVTPIAWASFKNWEVVFKEIEKLKPEIIIPGHGPIITDINEMGKIKRYVEYVCEQAERKYKQGVDAFDAALDIDLKDFADWPDYERIVVNIHSLYKYFNSDNTPIDAKAMFGLMAKYKAVKNR